MPLSQRELGVESHGGRGSHVSPDATPFEAQDKLKAAALDLNLTPFCEL